MGTHQGLPDSRAGRKTGALTWSLPRLRLRSRPQPVALERFDVQRHELLARGVIFKTLTAPRPCKRAEIPNFATCLDLCLAHAALGSSFKTLISRPYVPIRKDLPPRRAAASQRTHHKPRTCPFPRLHPSVRHPDAAAAVGDAAAFPAPTTGAQRHRLPGRPRWKELWQRRCLWPAPVPSLLHAPRRATCSRQSPLRSRRGTLHSAGALQCGCSPALDHGPGVAQQQSWRASFFLKGRCETADAAARNSQMTNQDPLHGTAPL